MIRRSALVALLAAGLSTLAHVGGLSALWSPDEVLIEGGAEATVARLGDSFRDVALGQLAPATVEDTLKEVPPEAAQVPVQPDQLVSEADVAPASQVKTPPVAQAVPIAPTERVRVAETTPDRSPAIVAPRADTMPPLQAAPPASPVAALRPQSLAQPADPPQTLADPAPPPRLTALPSENETAPQVSNRPSLRPRAIEEAAASRQPPTSARRTAQQKAKPAPSTPPRGNGETAERRGAAQGQEQATAQAAASAAGRKAQAAGNAAASNYPGTVMRQIQRRKPRTSIRGTAVVSFAIAPNGALAALSLSQSSGSAELDKLALNAVRRAAPFPSPPAGARTRFRLPVQGR